jgi:MFS family permease
VGAVILAFSLPAVLLSAVAGIFVDRHPKKTILVASNFLRVPTALGYILALRTLSGYPLLTTIYVLTFVNSAIGQFFGPAEGATIPLLVGQERLLAANSMFNLTFIATQVVGLVILAPLALKLLGIQGSFWVMTFMYLVSWLLVALLPRDEVPFRQNSGNSALERAWLEIKEGWRFVASHHSIYMAMLHLTLITTLLMIMAMLAPGFAARVLGMQTEDAVYVFAPAGVGMLLASFLVGHFGHRLRKTVLINGGLIALAVTLALLAVAGRLSEPLTVPLFKASPEMTLSVVGEVMILAFLVGFAMTLVTVPAQTILQEFSPPEVRGRVLAVQFTLANLVAIPPMLTVGNMADRLGIPRVLLVVALGVLLISGVSLYYARQQRRRKTNDE